MTEFRFDLSEILHRVDLERLLDHFGVASQGNGYRRRFSCPDPGHQDRDPSVTIGEKRSGHGQIFRCWSGGHHGDAVDVVEMMRPGSSKGEAIEWLAEWVGVSAGEQFGRPRTPAQRSPQFVEFSHLGKSYARRCAAVLRGPQGQRQLAWLADRGISPEVAAANLVGADPGFVAMRRTRGLPAGTIPGVTFPALSADGEILYVQLRSLPEALVDDGERSSRHAERGWRKYDNPSGKVGSNPRLSFQVCPHGVGRCESALLVAEGIPDALILAGAGFRAVAVLGNQTPDGQMAATLANVAGRDGLDVVLVVDADAGGDLARDLLVTELGKVDVVPVEVQLPVGMDVNDWALTEPDWARDLETKVGSVSGAHGRPVELGGGTVDSELVVRAAVADHLYGFSGPGLAHLEDWSGPDDVVAALSSWDGSRLDASVGSTMELGPDVASIDARLSADLDDRSWAGDHLQEVLSIARDVLVPSTGLSGPDSVAATGANGGPVVEMSSGSQVSTDVGLASERT